MQDDVTVCSFSSAIVGGGSLRFYSFSRSVRA